ncbi:MAG TPA: NmrA/HSCARG family protein [Polyangiales bacterium]|nr:NmrA/HSCARG family protein [Polyangiales bacterium]
MSDPATIVVCGATGQQGRAVVSSLLARGTFRVVALSRDPASSTARALEQRGAILQRADLGAVSELERAFEGAHAVFGVTQPWSPDYRHCDVTAEITQGRNIVDASARAGVRHLVLSTALRIDEKPTGIPHVDSKHAIEQHLFASGVPYTVLRPGTFMDNIGARFFAVRRGTIRGFTDGDARLPFVSCRDIGEAVASVFGSSAQWGGKAINLVGAWISGEDICAALGKLRHEHFRWKAPPKLLMRLFASEFYVMRIKMEQGGRAPYPLRSHLDEALHATRSLVPEPWGIEDYLRASGLVERTL